ncbi:RNA polymerase sigma factor [Micromonospora sp. CPCC 206061]|uniref:RNA polymerase sigma factor n=1 Tax=Micromonospora sp. CPCC 206061 TaxID=3122410 RepID=UPI003FA54F8B
MFDRYARDLLRYCTRRVGEQVAEDVVAETFLVAYEQRDRYDAERGGLLPWLYVSVTCCSVRSCGRRCWRRSLRCGASRRLRSRSTSVASWRSATPSGQRRRDPLRPGQRPGRRGRWWR